MEGSSPVPLSSCGSVERQCHTAGILAQLLGLPACDYSDEVLTEAIQRLRTEVFSADLDKSCSQARLVALQWAVKNDPSLLLRQMQQTTEAERQHFWNSIHKSIKEKDFIDFEFTREAFDAHWEEEKLNRECHAKPLKERLTALEGEREQKMKAWLSNCAREVGKFDWRSLTPNETIKTQVDALSMESTDSIWVTAEVCHPAASSGFARDLVLLVDLSGSMCDVMELLKKCLHDIVARTSTDDRLCVIGFHSTPQLLCDWTVMTADIGRTAVRTAIDAMAAHGGTSLVPAFGIVEDRLRQLPVFEVETPLPPAISSVGTLQLMPCMRGHTTHEAHSAPSPTALPEPRQRVSAVVLLSDGDPEEPPEAVWTSAAKAVSTSPVGKATLVALALGEGSNPALMALTAQCGGGPSLYIRGSSQMPEQIGRMWGYLNTLAKPRDLCLVLTPADEGEILEVERPLGGSVQLRSGQQQFVVMSCGSTVAGSTQRLAVLLKLPAWARCTCLDNDALQKPLLRMTWLWREGVQGPVQMTSSQLRVLQVPSLFLEAQLGLPVRVVIDSDWGLVASLDRSVFLSALASAMNIAADKLVLDRLSPGSIIADVRIVDPSSEELQSIRGACKRDRDAASNPCNVMGELGFPVKVILTPGSIVFRRVLQWRFARALESAARGGPRGMHALNEVQRLACGKLAQQLDPDREGIAAAVAADAAAAKELLLTHAQSGAELSVTVKHAFLQQAHGHCQQFCPELQPAATAVAAYESEALKLSASAFVASTFHRDTVLEAPILELLTPADNQQMNGVDPMVSLRLSAQGDGAMAVVAFRIEVSVASLPFVVGEVTQAYPNSNDMQEPDRITSPSAHLSALDDPQLAPLLVEDWSAAPGEALMGVNVNLGDLPVGIPLRIRAAVSNGSSLGLWSEPLQCSAHTAVSELPCHYVVELPCTDLSQELSSGVEHACSTKAVEVLNTSDGQPSRLQSKRVSLPRTRRSQQSLLVGGGRRNSRRQSSLTTSTNAQQIQLVEATLQPPDSVALAWKLYPTGTQSIPQRWSVALTPVARGGGHVLCSEVQGCSSQVSGLVASQAYRFCIRAAANAVPAAAPTGLGLCVQGSSIGHTHPPQPAEGIVLLPPFPNDLLGTLMQDPSLVELSEGVFLRKASDTYS